MLSRCGTLESVTGDQSRVAPCSEASKEGKKSITLSHHYPKVSLWEEEVWRFGIRSESKLAWRKEDLQPITWRCDTWQSPVEGSSTGGARA